MKLIAFELMSRGSDRAADPKLPMSIRVAVSDATVIHGGLSQHLRQPRKKTSKSSREGALRNSREKEIELVCQC